MNCPNLITSVYDFTEPFPSLEKYSDTLDIWSEVVGFNISANPVYASTLNDIYTSQVIITQESKTLYDTVGSVAVQSMLCKAAS